MRHFSKNTCKLRVFSFLAKKKTQPEPLFWRNPAGCVWGR